MRMRVMMMIVTKSTIRQNCGTGLQDLLWKLPNNWYLDFCWCCIALNCGGYFNFLYFWSDMLCYPAHALGLLLEDGAPTVQWGGARLFAALEGHPHGNGRNSETKSLKINPKVPNRRYCQGLQTGHWRNPGYYSKKRIFEPKSGLVAGKRPAERPPTGKLKLSRVTSGYGGLKIPLGRIRLTQKMGVIWV